MLQLAEPLHPSSLRLGAILAGGESRRFGSPKQLATVGGTRLVERVANAVARAGARPVLITGPGAPDLSHLLPCRSDARPGLGPVGGVHTALIWARELGVKGALCVACDLPFLPPPLLRRIAEIGESTSDVVVVPESSGPREVEPLCAWYPASAAQHVDSWLQSGHRSAAGLLATLELMRLPLREVLAFGDPAEIFLNVNTPADGERAAALQGLMEEIDGHP